MKAARILTAMLLLAACTSKSTDGDGARPSLPPGTSATAETAAVIDSAPPVSEPLVSNIPSEDTVVDGVGAEIDNVVRALVLRGCALLGLDRRPEAIAALTDAVVLTGDVDLAELIGRLRQGDDSSDVGSLIPCPS